MRVGKYGVDVACLDEIGVPAISTAVNNQWLVVIDEISPMELKSYQFRQAVMEVFNRDLDVLVSIVKRSLPFTDNLKRTPNIDIFEIRHDNRDDILEPFHALQNLSADSGVPLHNVFFFIGKFIRFADDPVRDTYFADVMDQRGTENRSLLRLW